MSPHVDEIDETWLVDGSANLVLAQIRATNFDERVAEKTQPASLQLLHQLLDETQGRLITHIIGGGVPGILIMPELSFGFEDWNEIDELVRQYPSPLILLAGFGFVKGEELIAWLAGGGPTRRIGAWLAHQSPIPGRVYNCGWCWIRTRDGKVQCTVFHKLTSEQRHETHVPNLAKGHTNYCVATRDLLLFPAICSDLLHIEAGQYPLHGHIKEYLESKGSDSRKVLVAGLMSQQEAHALWRNAISDAARLINQERVNVCLVNCAHEIIAFDEKIDRWRDYTGIYIAQCATRRPFSLGFEAARVFVDDHIIGAVSRTGGECVLGGAVRWTFGATTRHVWEVQKSFEINATGKLIEPACTDKVAFELLRFFRRISQSVDAPEISKKPYAIEALRRVADHVKSQSDPTSQDVCRMLLYGLPSPTGHWPPLDPDKIWNHEQALNLGARALGALLGNVQISWRLTKDGNGQLRLNHHRNILVWSQSERSITIRQKLDQLKTATLPAEELIVLCNAAGPLIEREPASTRREDITAPPNDNVRSVASATASNRIHCMSLGEIDACFDGVTPQESSALLNQFVETKLLILP